MERNQLPPGQQETAEFSRYGLFQYARRTHLLSPELSIKISGEVTRECNVTADALKQLNRVSQTSDFHCITTWTKRDVDWSGYLFKDFYESLLRQYIAEDSEIKYVVFRAQDNYRTYFLLEDLLTYDVLLADTLNDEPLSWQHGAPIRLVAPAHYGFRSAKHLCGIELRRNLNGYKSPGMHRMEHPRARVAYEERGRFLPAVFYRYIFRAFIPAVRWWYKRADKSTR